MLDDRSYMREPEWRDALRSGRAWSTVKILLVINIAAFLLLNIILHYGSDAMGGFVQQFMILKSGAVKAGIEYRTSAPLSSGQVLGIWDGAVWQLFTYLFILCLEKVKCVIVFEHFTHFARFKSKGRNF